THGIEKFVTGSIDPSTVNRRGLVCRNFPELREAAKVIKPDEIAGLGRPAQALYPPLIAGGTDRVPVVKRIAPALPGCAEIVWRYAGDRFRLQIIFFKAKKLTMRPYVSAVVVDENCNIADDAN